MYKKKVMWHPQTDKILRLSDSNRKGDEIANILKLSIVDVMDTIQRDYAYRQMYGK